MTAANRNRAAPVYLSASRRFFLVKNFQKAIGIKRCIPANFMNVRSSPLKRRNSLDNSARFCYNNRAERRIFSPSLARPVGQEVKTRPFHGCNMGSIPARVTTKKKALAKASAFFVVCGLFPYAARYRFAVTGALRRVTFAFGSYVPSESEALSLCASKISRRVKLGISLRVKRAISL